MVSRQLIFITLLSVCTIATADDFKERKKSIDAVTLARPSAKKIMKDVFNSFFSLVPYMSSEMKFTDPKNEKDIVKNLTNLNMSFSWAHQTKKLQNPKFSSQLKVMSQHVNGSLNSYLSNHKYYALNRLRATANLCISCHTQIPANRQVRMGNLYKTMDRKKFDNNYEYANFLIIMRKYDKALHYLELDMKEFVANKIKLLAEDPKLIWDDRKFNKALKSSLIIYTKIKSKPAQAIKYLKKWEKSKTLSSVTRKSINVWLKQLQNENPRLSKMSLEEIKSYLDKRDKKGDFDIAGLDMGLLIASGRLSHYKERSKKLDAPEYLYWMSKTEQQLKRSFFFNLAEVHLKNCIEGYSSNPWAKRCFTAYKDLITVGFTGSGGINIPEDEENEISRLEKLTKEVKTK